MNPYKSDPITCGYLIIILKRITILQNFKNNLKFKYKIQLQTKLGVIICLHSLFMKMEQTS